MIFMRKMRRLVSYALRAACLAAVLVLAGALLERMAAVPALASGDQEPDGPAAYLAMPQNVIQSRPAADPDDWRMMLVNQWNPLPEGFEVDTVEVERGYRFDRRAADKLTAMLDGCRDAGLRPLICSAYRSQDYQTGLFEKQVRKQEANGLSGEDAVQAAGEVVAVPGTSEHQLGLAADICSMDYQLLDEGQEQTPEYQWLREHCAEYGFILRYPPDTTAITGIIYEPWHFRYVGEEAAAYIMEQGITLEEYLQDA